MFFHYAALYKGVVYCDLLYGSDILGLISIKSKLVIFDCGLKRTFDKFGHNSDILTDKFGRHISCICQCHYQMRRYFFATALTDDINSIMKTMCVRPISHNY